MRENGNLGIVLLKTLYSKIYTIALNELELLLDDVA
jgi:hypothetical protein